MKKKSIVFILIISIVLISGCTSEEKTNSGTSTQDIYKSDSTNYQTDIRQAQQEKLMQIEHFIDPKLENQQIEIDNPNIEIVSFKLNDNRAYEKDNSWNIELVIQNNAKVPVWVTSGLIGMQSITIYFVPLDSGERTSYVITSRAIQRGQILEQFLETENVIQFPAFNSVKPKISSEFGYLEIRNINNDLFSPPLDINSIKFEIDENKWKYVVVEVTNPSNSRNDINVDIVGGKLNTDYMNSEDNEASSSINPGETKSLKISLTTHNPEDFDTLRIYSRKHE